MYLIKIKNKNKIKKFKRELISILKKEIVDPFWLATLGSKTSLFFREVGDGFHAQLLEKRSLGRDHLTMMVVGVLEKMMI